MGLARPRAVSHLSAHCLLEPRALNFTVSHPSPSQYFFSTPPLLDTVVVPGHPFLPPPLPQVPSSSVTELRGCVSEFPHATIRALAVIVLFSTSREASRQQSFTCYPGPKVDACDSQKLSVHRGMSDLFLKDLFSIVCMCVGLCTGRHRCPQRTEEGTGLSGAEVMGVCEV